MNTGVVVKKYYYAAGQRIAMREMSNGGDHLGTVSLTTDGGGSVVAEARYLPFGERRWESGQGQTDFGFTGQRGEGFGLADYRARFYSPALMRFVSADSLVPDPWLAADYDRFAYVRSNPLKYVDPSGQNPECGPDGIYCNHGLPSEEDTTRLTIWGARMAQLLGELNRIKGWWYEIYGWMDVKEFMHLIISYELSTQDRFLVGDSQYIKNLKEGSARWFYQKTKYDRTAKTTRPNWSSIYPPQKRGFLI